MSMTIRVGVKPEALTRLAGAAASGSPIKPSAGLGFLDLAAREVARKAGEVSKEEMTLQEYKQYISARISAIRIDPSHALESLRVQISDEGLKAMKTDEDYETWVLEMLEKAWSTPSTGMPGTFITYNIGAEREPTRGGSWKHLKNWMMRQKHFGSAVTAATRSILNSRSVRPSCGRCAAARSPQRNCC